MAGEQIKRRLREYEKEPYRIVITGATSQIAQTLIVCMGSGYFLGLNRPIILNLFDVATIESCLIASKMELEDCAFDNIIEINCTVDEQVAFIDADLIVMIGCVSRREGMERSELLGTNVIIFAEQAININKFAKPTCKILVTGNPANTNAFIVKQYAPNILPENITCLARLDQNRAMAQIASKMKITTSSISNVTIFGNHSSLQYPHAWDAKYNDNGIPKSVVQKLDNDHWLKNTFVDVVRERGHQIIKNKKSASGCSVAKAILDHLVMWNYGSQNEIISIGLESKGEYGVPDGLFFNFPTKISDSGTITVDTSIGISDYDKEILQLNIKELQSEKDLALSIVQEVLEPKLLKNKNK